MDRPGRQVVIGGGLATGLIALLAWCSRRWCRCCVGGRLDWPAAPAWAADGTMTNVASFTAFVDAERPCFRHYPESSAQAVLGMDPSGSEPQPAFTLEYHPSAGSGETDVIIILDDLGDVAVAAARYVLTFVDEGFIGGTSGVHRLVAGRRELRCEPGHGHQDWDTTPCT